MTWLLVALLLALAGRVGYLIFRDLTRALAQAQRLAAGECTCRKGALCPSCLAASDVIRQPQPQEGRGS